RSYTDTMCQAGDTTYKKQNLALKTYGNFQFTALHNPGTKPNLLISWRQITFTLPNKLFY
ncbi:MAG: hypothetical protein AAFW66_16090, partial [Pseudomonadota bacterium]